MAERRGILIDRFYGHIYYQSQYTLQGGVRASQDLLILTIDMAQRRGTHSLQSLRLDSLSRQYVRPHGTTFSLFRSHFVALTE